MTQLVQEKCVACRRDSPHVTERDIAELHPLIPDWRIVEEEGVPRLSRTFRFPSFARALDFTNAIGTIAEQEGHHPRIVTEWGQVGVSWWTHKIRHMHRNDFIMAAKTDQLYGQAAIE